MKVIVERGLVAPEPKIASGASGEGFTVTELVAEGYVIRIVLSPAEARTLGGGMIGAAAIEDFIAAQRRPQVVDAKGTNVVPIFGGKS